jgi:hypothetical protein
MSYIGSLPRVILNFEQRKESIGAAWAWFSTLTHGSPDLSLPDGVILRLFCSGLDIDADLCLDVTTGGWFTHKTMMEQVEFLEHFIAKHTSSVTRTKPLQAKVMSSVEESSFVESKPIPSLGLTYEPSLESRAPKKTMLHPSEFSIKFEDYGNTSKISQHEKRTK